MTLVPLRKSQEPAYRSGFDEFDRVFDNFFRNALTNISTPATSLGNMALRMNVSESDKAYHIEAELPGVEEKDIELTVKDGVLNISGEKESREEKEGRTFHRVEQSYGSFQRNMQLPADADESKIDAHVKNGVLSVEIAKLKEAQQEPRRISIKSKS